jgi:hypothetical protein
LVPNFYWTNTVAGRDSNAANDPILRSPAEVAVVEIDEILVLDARSAIATGEDVPYRLIKAACDEAPLR